MKISINYLSLLKMGLVSPTLMMIAWRIKKERKTYLSYQHLLSLVENYFRVRNRNDNYIQVAEFGVGRGGSAIVLAWLVENYGGTLTLYDVFDRIPQPSLKDGKRAFERYETILKSEREDYYGNIPDLLEVITNDLVEVCNLNNIHFRKGKYEDTLQAINDSKHYGLIHIDCDWYESVSTVLNYLKRNIIPGAVIQVDDYSNWQGAKLAIDESMWLRPYVKKIINGPLVIDTHTVKNLM